VDHVLGMDRHSLRSVHVARGVAATWRLLKAIRTGGFDLVVDFQNYDETAALAWLSGAKVRIGFASRQLRGRAFTAPAPRWGVAHPVDENLRLLHENGLTGVADPPNSIVMPGEHVERARTFLEEHGVDKSQSILFIQPLTSAEWKNWPLERYLAVAREFRARGIPVVVGGGPGDREALSPWKDEGFAVTTEEPLMTDAGLMQLSAVVVGGDTGLIHLAVAMGRRVAVLMGSEEPNQAIPYRRPEWVITPAPGSPLGSIGESEVIEHITEALSALGTGSVSGRAR